jgi:hypothetical protein
MSRRTRARPYDRTRAALPLRNTEKSAPSAAASIGTAARLATNAFNPATHFNLRNLSHNLSGAFVASATKPQTRKEDL